MDKLILIDGNSLLFRAYFAMRPMVTSNGIYTQGIYAFINMLNKIIGDYNPTHIAVAFDLKEKTFRHDVYKEYKAGRLATPIELLSEIPLLHRVLEAMNIKVIEMPKYEADDLIGTVAKKASLDGLNTLIISGDKDELQLVDDNVNVLINKKGMTDFDLYDLNAMKERYKLTPTQFIDLKGLMGDKSDNIPGIPSVGEKKGIALLTQYESLESIIEHADEIPGKLGEAVRENIESAKLSKWLATINVDAPLSVVWDEFKYIEPNYEELVSIYTELEFSSFIKKLDNQNNSNTVSSEVNELTVNVDTVSFNEFVSKVKDESLVYISLDTDDNHVETPVISAIHLYYEDMNIYCCKELTMLDANVTVDLLKNKRYRLIGFNLKEVLYSLLSYSYGMYFPYYDVEIAEYLLDSSKSNYYISKMLIRYAGTTLPDNPSKLELLVAVQMIMKEQSKQLIELKLDQLFESCEMPLVNTLAKMEYQGISVDVETLRNIGDEITDKISELEAKIYNQAGHSFNINSPKQLATVLFEELSLPYPKAKGKTSSYSTAQDILDKLKVEYSIVSNVLEYRKASKLNSTYVEGLIPLVGSDNKIHPHFQQTVTATGRLSCTEPNLQNIPVRDDYGRLIRKAFIVSSKDNIFTGSDYSQIELRVLASLSEDEGLIADFKAGKDIHRSTAARVFNLSEDQVTPLDRSKAKAVNFGVVYGMSSFGLSDNLNISRAEGQQYINDYFEKHQAVKSYLDNLVVDGESNRMVRTHYGRIRQIPEFASRKYMEREFAKRLAMNTPIQGTAADIIKFAMNAVSNELGRKNLESKLILQIHDELIIEGPISEKDEVKLLLEKCMKEASNLVVELTCDTHTGSTWYELK